MKKSDVETIILQEDEIKRLKKENKSLWRGYCEYAKIIDRLLKENKKLKNQANELSGVNV
jgi:FtsZ-binding cell division protein ZapB